MRKHSERWRRRGKRSRCRDKGAKERARPLECNYTGVNWRLRH